MERVIDLILKTFAEEEFSIFGLLCSAFTFILGVVCTKYKVKEWFYHKRIWTRLIVCLGILIVAMALNCCIIVAGVFSFFVLVSAFIPLPHEFVLLHYYKTHHEALENKKHYSWLVTTSALLRFYELKIKACVDEVEKQNVQIAFLDEAKIWDLFGKEYIRFYLPNLDVLFRIGAIKTFETECLRLARFDKTSYMLTFKTYLAHNEFDYEKMAELESQCAEKDDDGKLVSLLNKLCSYEASGEKEKMKPIIEELLDFKRKGIIHIELYHDLMHYFDEIVADKEAADKLAGEIEKINIAQFNDSLEFLNIAFMYYRRNSCQHKIEELIERIVAENEHRQCGEKQMITRIKLMYVMLDNGYKWQEYSIGLFKDRARYLDSGYHVGTEFIKETSRFLRDVGLLKHQGLLRQLENEMFEDFKRYAVQYISDIESDIAKLDDRFLYRKRNLLMLKLDLLKLNVGDDIVLLRKNNDEIYDRVTEMCRCSGDQREYLHFLVVHADDILTVDNQVMEAAKANAYYANSKYQKEYEGYRRAYINKAEGIVDEVVNRIKLRNYDKSLAYYVIYTSYLLMLLGNKQDCLFFFTMYEKYNVDIKNWTEPIQKMYKSL